MALKWAKSGQVNDWMHIREYITASKSVRIELNRIKVNQKQN